MRAFLLSVLAAILFLGNVGSADAQKDKGKDKDKDKKHEWPTELGGKTPAEWIKAIAQPNRSESVKALEMVMRFGPKLALEAIPTILAELKKHKPKEGKRVDASFVSKAPLALATIVNSATEIGEKVEPKLIKEIVTVLKGQLKDPQITTRYRTLMALAQFGSYMNDAVDEIIALVRDPDTYEIRQAAVMALGGYHFDHKKDTPPVRLSEALLKYGVHDPSTSVRLAALLSVERLGLASLVKTKGPVEEYITQLLFGKYPEKDATVRITAHKVAYGITKEKNKGRRDAIGAYLKSKESAVRMEAITALTQIGAASKDQLDKLENCLDTKLETQVRVLTLQALAHIGPLADQENAKAGLGGKLAKLIADYIADKDPGVRATALMCLGHLGKGSEPFLKQITKSIANNDEEWSVRLAGFNALASLGPVAKGQLGFVTDFISNKDEKLPVRLAAIETLAHMGPGQAPVMKTLTACLTEKNEDVVNTSAIALAGMGKDALGVLPDLQAVVNNRTYSAALHQSVQLAINHIKKEQSKTSPKKGGEK